MIELTELQFALVCFIFAFIGAIIYNELKAELESEVGKQ
jgi:hypothetical protein